MGLERRRPEARNDLLMLFVGCGADFDFLNPREFCSNQ
jgi:hypothetical protein